MIMEVVPEGVDQINGAVTCIRFGMPWFQDYQKKRLLQPSQKLSTCGNVATYG